MTTVIIVVLSLMLISSWLSNGRNVKARKALTRKLRRVQADLVQADDRVEYAGARADRAANTAAAYKGELTNTTTATEVRAYVENYTFPGDMVEKALSPFNLSDSAKRQAENGFRQFLYAAGVSPKRQAAMPSKIVDELWHTFITYTRDYQAFCIKAYGTFLHHVPETTMSDAEMTANHTAGMKNAWKAAATYAKTEQVPDLFAIDAEQGIPHATTYLLEGEVNGPHQVLVSSFLGDWRYKNPPVKLNKPAAKAPAKASSTSSSSSTTSSSTADGSAAVLGIVVAAGVDSAADTNTSSSSGGGSTPTSTCGSSSSSCGSSSSSCGSSSSSCGGGGGCGGG